VSFAHIRLEKTGESEKCIIYSALSSDFNEAHEWQEVAELIVDRARGTHTFSLRNVWLGKKVVPPYVYGLSEEKRRHALSHEFTEHGYGAWTGRIWAQLQKIQAAVSP
jgi:hypothetical protein